MLRRGQKYLNISMLLSARTTLSQLQFAMAVALLCYTAMMLYLMVNHHLPEFELTPVLKQLSSRKLSKQKTYVTRAKEVCLKWNLTTPNCAHLLEQQFYRVDDYNPDTDFLYLNHIQKTGGTTISDLLKKALGEDSILPGSHRSGAFMTPGCINPRKFNMTPRKGVKLDHWAKLNTIEHHADSDPSYLVSFSHTKLRPLVGPDKTNLATFFELYFAHKPKRIRELGMLREPMALRASAHAMLQCAINRKVKQFNSQRESEGLGAICTPEEGLNVSALWDERVEQYMSNCPSSSEDDSYEYIDKYNRMLCKNGQQSLEHCRGATQLLESGRPYNMAMKALLRGLMGRYTAEEEDKHEVASEQVEEYTLFDLGGIMNVSNDFVWFGITERMEESTCLLYYTLMIKPLNQTPTSRVMDCSPTSWWTEENREKVKQMEPSDYAVWRAANAILDIRIMIMQEDIRSKLNNEKDLTRREIDQNRALVEAGCLQLSLN